MKLKEDMTAVKTSNMVLTSGVEAMDKYIKALPTKNDLDTHAKAMDESLVAKLLEFQYRAHCTYGGIQNVWKHNLCTEVSTART